jgi:hypothetical protein
MIGKVLAANGKGYYDDWIKCIVDTTDRGANIINLSLAVSSISNLLLNFELKQYQGPRASTGLEQAINYATEKGDFHSTRRVYEYL